MEKISFEKMLKSKNEDLILIGEGLNMLGKDRMSKNIKEQLPISARRINSFIHKTLGSLDYINFWSKIEIYKVVY